MNPYVDMICPCCQAAFKDNDDIDICDSCGKPHHRDCWIKHGGCTLNDCQGRMRSLQETLSRPSFCRQCGAPLNSVGAFCSQCGTPIKRRDSHSNSSAFSESPKAKDPITETFESFRQKAVRAVATDDRLDSGLADYIGNKREYYLRSFSALKQKKRYDSWNWAAFFFSSYWCVYRKMYAIGAVVLGVQLLLTLLAGWFGSLLCLVISVLAAVFGNYAYLYDLEKRIRRERSLPENLRPSFVMKNGGTNTAAAILVCIAYTLVSLVFTFIMVHI